MDVLQMPKELKALNKNCYQFLLMIDVVSRKAFVRVLQLSMPWTSAPQS